MQLGHEKRGHDRLFISAVQRQRSSSLPSFSFVMRNSWEKDANIGNRAFGGRHPYHGYWGLVDPVEMKWAVNSNGKIHKKK